LETETVEWKRWNWVISHEPPYLVDNLRPHTKMSFHRLEKTAGFEETWRGLFRITYVPFIRNRRKTLNGGKH
jgi:hypothetical protein